MDPQLSALLMFLLLSYLLFRRPASAAVWRCPTELDVKISSRPIREADPSVERG